FRSKDDRPAWRNFWDWMLFLGSFLPALLWGVALANMIRGVPIDAKMQYTGTFFDLLSPYTLLAGITSLLLFTLQGALFLALKTGDELPERARQAGLKIGTGAAVAFLLLLIMSYRETDIFTHLGPAVAFWSALATLILARWLLRARNYILAFIFNGLTILLGTGAIFGGLFPRVMVSSLNPQWSLTIYEASSSPYTLKVMTIVALTLVPVVLLYQGWTYWVFRQRVKDRNLEY
ncbi:MAG: cytochrome d ubiquinol oxidase subunit II, partial [Thermoanaerobacteraceae bacterium]|nr:cytochrome d ubiquinol oxidase subunit II [Thermoanaerobacteraceae bacterium]